MKAIPVAVAKCALVCWFAISAAGQPAAVFSAEEATTEPRFLDNGNGTVTDTGTGLIWQKTANCFERLPWKEAGASCATLASGKCGLDDGSKAGDWRLPDADELKGLLVEKKPRPALPEGHPFENVQPTWYWTSKETSYDSNFVWAVHFSIGGGVNYKKTNSSPVWCVRDRRTDEEQHP